jgi:hypothetical protein
VYSEASFQLHGMGSDKKDFVNNHRSFRICDSQIRGDKDGFTEEQKTMRNCLNSLATVVTGHPMGQRATPPNSLSFSSPKALNRLPKFVAIVFVASCGLCFSTTPVVAQNSDASQALASVDFGKPAVAEGKKRATKEPVYRVAKGNPIPHAAANTANEANPVAASAIAASNVVPNTIAAPTAEASASHLTANITPSPSVSTSNAMRTASATNSVNPVAQSVSMPNAVSSPVSATNSAQATAVLASSVTPSNSITPHPLDRAIEMAKEGLINIQSNVHDYSAIMVKRERIDGTLGCPEYMQMKIRCPRTIAGKQVPFSVYLKTLKPRKSAGREVVWIQGENGNKLCAHETGLLGMKRFYLDPDGWVAMKSNRYPIYDAGIENLIIKLIEKANFAKNTGHSVVNYRDNAEIMKRKCFLIELVNQQRHEGDEFFKAHVFIDKELNLPVRYVAYDWPTSPSGKPEVIEEYTYVKINLNQGFSDIDFSPENPAYKFPSR